MYTAASLITDAYYLSGVVSPDFNVVSGAQLTRGLKMLNAVLAIKTANKQLIPYYNTYTLNAVINQKLYFIPNLIDLETITFNLDTVVQIPMYVQSRTQFFQSYRINNLTTLPFEVHLERAKGGANLYIYPVPNDDYPINLTGKFSLASVTIDEDLEEELDEFYLENLRYALAEYICAQNKKTFFAQAQQKLDEYENILVSISPKDFSMQKASTLSNTPSMNWGMVNLFNGYLP